MKYRSYPTYQPSGVEWLREVPTHWKVKRLKYTATLNPKTSEVKGLNSDTEVSFVPMEAVGEFGGLDLSLTKQLADVLQGYTFFGNGDVLVAKITPCFENGKGSLARGLLNGIAFGTTELHVIRCRPGLNNRFAFYATQGDAFRKIGKSEMYGAGGQKRIPESFVADLKHPIPPLTEQCTIAAFLDRETEKIDSLVAKKKRLIELLQEKRTALISRVVTKGLDPNVPTKDSGVEWLGEIPAYWEVKPLKRAVTFQRGHDLPSEAREQGNVLVISSSGVHATHSKAAAKAPSIVTGRYGTIGKFYLIDEDFWPLNTTLYSIDLHGNEPRFLQYMLSHLAPLFLLNASKSAVPGVDRSDIHVVDTVVPPVTEQYSIADFLKRENRKLDNLAEKVQEAIGHLKELRSALISAAVTGRIDVREEVA